MAHNNGRTLARQIEKKLGIMLDNILMRRVLSRFTSLEKFMEVTEAELLAMRGIGPHYASKVLDIQKRLRNTPDDSVWVDEEHGYILHPKMTVIGTPTMLFTLENVNDPSDTTMLASAKHLGTNSEYDAITAPLKANCVVCATRTDGSVDFDYYDVLYPFVKKQGIVDTKIIGQCMAGMYLKHPKGVIRAEVHIFSPRTLASCEETLHSHVKLHFMVSTIPVVHIGPGIFISRQRVEGVYYKYSAVFEDRESGEEHQCDLYELQSPQSYRSRTEEEMVKFQKYISDLLPGFNVSIGLWKSRI